MKPIKNILGIAPAIIVTYSLSFIQLPFNIFSNYYFQAILKPGIAFLISLLHGCTDQRIINLAASGCFSCRFFMVCNVSYRSDYLCVLTTADDLLYKAAENEDEAEQI